MSIAVCPGAPWRARGWRRGVLDQYGGAGHARPDAVPTRCRVAELCSDRRALRPLHYAPGSGRAEHKILESRLLVARRRRCFRVLLATLFTSEIDILFA